jgi:hypothetical protein
VGGGGATFLARPGRTGSPPTLGTVSFPAVKQSEGGVYHPTTSSAEVTNLELHIRLAFVVAFVCYGVTLTFNF